MLESTEEYKIILNKALKSVDMAETERQQELFFDGSAQIKELHRDVDTLQHNNTFTVEHEEGGDGAKRQFRKMAKRVVSAALLPAMKQQSLYNSTATRSLYNLTLVSQKLLAQSKRNKDLLDYGMRKIMHSISELEKEVKSLNGLRPTAAGAPEGGRISFSKAGEDLIISDILNSMGIAAKDATYLETGVREGSFGNTRLFNLEGANGVLILPNPNALTAERTHGDVVINKCLASSGGAKSRVYVLSASGVCTQSLEAAREYCEANVELYVDYEAEMECISLNSAVAENFEDAPLLLSLDVEGSRLIDTLDLHERRPLVIALEARAEGALWDKSAHSEAYLSKNAYSKFASTGYCDIFVDERLVAPGGHI